VVAVGSIQTRLNPFSSSLGASVVVLAACVVVVNLVPIKKVSNNEIKRNTKKHTTGPFSCRRPRPVSTPFRRLVLQWWCWLHVVVVTLVPIK
jgi:hypothetical protein